MKPLDDYIKNELNRKIGAIGDHLQADTMSICSPIIPIVADKVRDAVEMNGNKQEHLAIILQT